MHNGPDLVAGSRQGAQEANIVNRQEQRAQFKTAATPSSHGTHFRVAPLTERTANREHQNFSRRGRGSSTSSSYRSLPLHDLPGFLFHPLSSPCWEHGIEVHKLQQTRVTANRTVQKYLLHRIECRFGLEYCKGERKDAVLYWCATNRHCPPPCYRTTHG